MPRESSPGRSAEPASWGIRGITALLGVVGGIGFAAFSTLVPLTGIVVSIQFTRSLVHVVPAFLLLIAAWATAAGTIELAQAPRVLADDHAS